jgi:hypothetical protein
MRLKGRNIGLAVGSSTICAWICAGTRCISTRGGITPSALPRISNATVWSTSVGSARSRAIQRP